jgi:hypothetical protein
MIATPSETLGLRNFITPSWSSVDMRLPHRRRRDIARFDRVTGSVGNGRRASTNGDGRERRSAAENVIDRPSDAKAQPDRLHCSPDDPLFAICSAGSGF